MPRTSKRIRINIPTVSGETVRQRFSSSMWTRRAVVPWRSSAELTEHVSLPCQPDAKGPVRSLSVGGGQEGQGPSCVQGQHFEAESVVSELQEEEAPGESTRS